MASDTSAEFFVINASDTSLFGPYVGRSLEVIAGGLGESTPYEEMPRLEFDGKTFAIKTYHVPKKSIGVDPFVMARKMASWEYELLRDAVEGSYGVTALAFGTYRDGGVELPGVVLAAVE